AKGEDQKLRCVVQHHYDKRQFQRQFSHSTVGSSVAKLVADFSQSVRRTRSSSVQPGESQPLSTRSFVTCDSDFVHQGDAVRRIAQLLIVFVCLLHVAYGRTELAHVVPRVADATTQSTTSLCTPDGKLDVLRVRVLRDDITDRGTTPSQLTS